MTDPVAAGYDAVYAAWSSSPAFHALWAQHAVEGELEPGFEHLNFAPLEQMRRMAAELRLRPHERLVDVACGAGGPGLWIARETGAALVGVDLSIVGTRLAARRAREQGIGAEFVVGTATGVGLAGECVAGAMSIDSLQYVRDKRAAFGEIARVLFGGSRLVFTAFELDPGRVVGLPVLGDDPVPDYEPLLQAAGFSVDVYEETPGWKARLHAAYSAIIAAEDTLRPDVGREAMDALLLEMTLTLEIEPYRRRVFVVAHRPH